MTILTLSQATMAGITNNPRYRAQVRAVNSAGAGNFS